jgi:mannose PTS system EIID component
MAGIALQKLTEGASILGLFVMGVLVNRWTIINVPVVLSEITQADGVTVTTTVQTILDSLLPGLLPLILTFICMKLLKKKVNAVWLIFGIFALGIVGYLLGWLA